MKNMDGCIFCNIIKKEKPAYIIYQDNLVTAFLDINPVAKGHTLISTNQHVEKLNNLIDDEVSNALMKALLIVTNKLIKSGLCSDYLIVQSNGNLAEQDIMHIHFHIIPRHENDGVLLKLDTDQEEKSKENLLDTFKSLVT